MQDCPFCDMPEERILIRNDRCYAVRDRFPVTEGHTLIIPFRHVASFRHLTSEELLSIWELARKVAEGIEEADPEAGAFNLGVNDGTAAGQTVFHVHVHLIPRRDGDMPNPRGGVRGVIPGKQNYPAAAE